MKKLYTPVSAEEAVKVIKSGDHVHISSISNAPQCLIKAMCDRGRAGELKNVFIHSLFTQGEAPYVAPEFEGIFQHNAFFIGDNVREGVKQGLVDYIPVSLSEIPKIYRENYIHINVAMVQITPPDKFGWASMGPAVETNLAALEMADYRIAVINKNVPRTMGDSMIPIAIFDHLVEDNAPLPVTEAVEPNAQEKTIGRYCAELVEDGSCLQLGIGSIPNAVLSCLKYHKNLGIHTEMFSDGVLPLVKSGVINGMCKGLNRFKIVSTFAMGSKSLYDFLDNNPYVLMKECSYTNDPFIIGQQPKMVSINSALQVDISGQVCADSLGARIYSGVGGQNDFIYGASRSKGGKPIIAMPSITKNGISKIVPSLAEGAGTVTTRNNIHYLITEFGAVDLYGKSMQERAKLIISVAHPSAQEELDKAAFERFGSHYYYIKGIM